MPKEIKGEPRRKPPEPSVDHTAIDTWFGDVFPAMQPIVRGVDASIRAAIPNVHYGVKFHRAFYGLPELGWTIEVAPYFRSINVLFFGGADFTPPPPLGSTGRTRYLKLTSADAVQDPDLLSWIDQSSRTPGWT